MTDIRKLLKAGKTRRWHTEFVVGGDQTLADHSWGVARILTYLWPDSEHQVIMACLDHDLAEAWLGDIPAPAKESFPEINDAFQKAEAQIEKDLGIRWYCALTTEDRQRIRAADMLESLHFAIAQAGMGNTNFIPVMTKITTMIQTLTTEMSQSDAEKVWKFFTELMK